MPLAQRKFDPLGAVRHFDSAGLPVRERFDAWRDSFEFFYATSPVADRENNADWRHSAWRLNDLVVTTHDLGPFVGHRGPTQIKRESEYQMLVRYVREGMQHGLHNGQPVVMQAGGVYIYRADREFSTLVKDRVRTMAVGIAFDPQILTPDQMPTLMALDPHAGSTRILKNIMERIEDTVCGRRCNQNSNLHQQFRSVLLDILRPKNATSPGRTASIAARRSAMKGFIDQNLNKPGFDVDQLFSAFGASRATIFRDFAPDGGLQHYVTSRRLERAFDDLSNTPPYRGKIQTVAAAHGFPDTGHFSRLFRQHFGITPSDTMMIGRLATK